MRMSEDRTILGKEQTAVLVGAVIQKDDHFLLVRELKDVCRGKWNFPGGHLKPGESIFDGTIREVKEESGHDIELTGRYSSINCVSDHGTLLLIPFAAKSIRVSAQPNAKEISEIGWFTRAEINAMRAELRFPELIADLLDEVEQGHTLPLSTIRVYR